MESQPLLPTQAIAVEEQTFLAIPNNFNDFEIISDESKNKQFSHIAQGRLLAAWNQGVTGKTSHADERKKIAQSLMVDVQRVTVSEQIF